MQATVIAGVVAGRREVMGGAWKGKERVRKIELFWGGLATSHVEFEGAAAEGVVLGAELLVERLEFG